MGALAPVSHWLPEDDLLLRKAVEAGASLESLAKGAVEFSRKFTFMELKDRWHSLLFDPIVSVEASSCMVELEYSTPTLPPKFNFNRIGNPKETMAFPAKRNAESVRSHYYALRKRMRMEPFDAIEDLNYMVGPNNAGCMGNVEEPLLGNSMLDDDPLNNFQFEESHLEIINNAFPDIFGDVPCATSVDGFHIGCDNKVVSNVPENFSFIGNGSELNEQMVNPPSQFGEVRDQMGNVCSDFERDQVFGSPIPQCGPSPAFEDLDCLSQIPSTAKQMNEENLPSAFPLDIATGEKDLHAKDQDDDTMRETSEYVLLSDGSEDRILGTDCYFAELSHCLFDEEDKSLDEDDKGPMDKSCYDLFLNSSNDANSPDEENMAVGTEQAGTSVAPECHKYASSDVLGMGVNNNVGSCLNLSPAPAWEPHPEIRDGCIKCLLNRESDEIPDNDHISVDPSPPCLNFSSEPRNPKSWNSVPTSARELSANKKPGKPPVPSHRIIAQAKDMKIGRPNPVAECCVKPKLPSSNGFGKSNVACLRPACRNTDVPSSVLKDDGIATGKPTATSDLYLNFPQNEISIDNTGGDTLQDQQTQNAGVDMNASTVEPEEDNVASDDDLPHYSDIEAMILGTELDPDGQDLFELEVSRYQHDDVKKAIMRLEQSARSYMQQEIASRGAFAVLYGRYSKHYIKKSNVLLGRATGEYPVDIDLGRAGSKTQVSRRQAIISLKNDGSFHIKNIGKFPISVNDAEIERGKVLNIETNCLIEIRGMPFIFETNETCVKRYLDSVGEDQPQ